MKDVIQQCQSVSWPQAVAIVGCAFAAVAFIWVILKGI